MSSLNKTWPENTVENKIKWASMSNRPAEFRMLHTTIKEVKKFFETNSGLSLPQIAEEISKLVDLLLCSGFRSEKEDEAEYAEEVVEIKNVKDKMPFYLIYKKKKRQDWIVDNFVRKYAPHWAEELLELSPTFNLAYLISYAAYAFHFRVGNCGEHAMLTLTLLLCGGRDYFRKNDIYGANFVITKRSGSNHAQVLLVRGKRFAEIIKSYFSQKKLSESKEFSDLGIKSWPDLIKFNWKVLDFYEKAKQEKQKEKEYEAAVYFYDLLSIIDDDDIENIHRKLEHEKGENAYIADGFWGIAERPRERIKNEDTLNFNAAPLFRWGRTPDLKVLFSRILYEYKDFLLSN